MTNYLSSAQARTEKVTEFCTDEKQAYFASIQKNFPGQFANIQRVESNTYWIDDLIDLFLFVQCVQANLFDHN